MSIVTASEPKRDAEPSKCSCPIVLRCPNPPLGSDKDTTFRVAEIDHVASCTHANERSEVELELLKQTFDAYLTEYQKCIDMYNSIYGTIWQSAAWFSGLAVAILAIVKIQLGASSPLDVPAPYRAIATLPVLIWYVGVFTPMNRYGDQRAQRAEEIEAKFRSIGIQLSAMTQHNKRFIWKWLDKLIGWWPLTVFVISSVIAIAVIVPQSRALAEPVVDLWVPNFPYRFQAMALAAGVLAGWPLALHLVKRKGSVRSAMHIIGLALGLLLLDALHTWSVGSY